jgi:hypothetical protein
MARVVKRASAFFDERIQPRSRVLLINPPVHERRYHWLRWNQPTDLLRLSASLKTRASRVDVRLYDFMFPDVGGNVAKHKVKTSWGEEGQQLWHFGEPYRDFEDTIARWLVEKWIPDVVVITSLTSYWHSSISTLIGKLLNRLGRTHRERATICLYGNYPKFEPAHASNQDVDVVLTETVDTSWLQPDFGLYLDRYRRSPLFYGLDIYDQTLPAQIEACLEIEARALKLRGIDNGKPPTITLAFLNDNIGRPNHRWDDVVRCVETHPKQIVVEGIAGIEPSDLTRELLEKLKASKVRTLFVEHARKAGGDLDVEAYAPLIEVMLQEQRAKQSGRSSTAWLDKAAVTGFVSMGLRDDNIDCLVRSTLLLNKYFEGVILKPFGFSPINNPVTDAERESWWPKDPSAGSPQWFPFADRGGLKRDDYQDLIRWQNLLNKRVKGSTFDFLGEGAVSKLVRETLVTESWKRHREAR